MVREQRPESNGASVQAGGVGSCYAELGMTDTNNSTSYETTYFSCETEPITPPETDDCTGEWMVGDGVGGYEEYLGDAESY
jgi:hypothetical protein